MIIIKSILLLVIIFEVILLIINSLVFLIQIRIALEKDENRPTGKLVYPHIYVLSVTIAIFYLLTNINLII